MKKKIYSTKVTKKSTKITTKKGSTDFLEESQKIKEKSWYVFFSAYIRLADNGCDYLIDNGLSGENKYIIVGIIYNLKHSLEVLVKSLLKNFDNRSKKDMEKDIERTHVTKDLFEKLKKSPKFENFEKKKKFETNQVKLLICKYDELPILKEYLKGNFIIGDYKNEFFKYPENDTKIIVDYAKLLNQFNKKNIKEIKEDIKKIFNIVKGIKTAIK